MERELGKFSIPFFSQGNKFVFKTKKKIEIKIFLCKSNQIYPPGSDSSDKLSELGTSNCNSNHPDRNSTYPHSIPPKTFPVSETRRGYSPR